MLRTLKNQLKHNRHRALVVLSGNWSWVMHELDNQILPIELSAQTLWLGSNAPAQVSPIDAKKARQWLGRECHNLIINGFDGIDLNALGALSGTVGAGGFCVLLCPDLSTWCKQPDKQSERFCVYQPNDEQNRHDNRWLSYFVALLQQDPLITIITEQGAVKVAELPESTVTKEPELHSQCKSTQQFEALEKIIKVATGHRRRPLVVSADRGRGKSSALGLAVVRLLKQGKSKIIISAPQVSSCSEVFARAMEQLDILQQNPTRLQFSQGELLFVPPDELIRNKHECDLLLIDEAAAIATPMLTKILKQYARIVFTTTIAGYEGTGRGFEIRFKKVLDELTPNWQFYTMSQPIRYGEKDPLEGFINQALLLDAKAAEVGHIGQLEPLTLKHWDRDQLLNDIDALTQIMGLLVLSHYKTSPNDLRHLLDGNNIEIYSFAQNHKILACTLLAIEGGLPESLCQQVYQGNRRPKGHLLPQTLCFHSGILEAPTYRYGRIVRIAVHPQLHNQGIGSEMLKQLSDNNQQLDFLGSSFGATAELLRFWHNNHYTSVRLGLSVDATSNEYSAVVLKPISHNSKVLLEKLRNKFEHTFAPDLIEFYLHLACDVIIELLQNNQPILAMQLSAELRAEVADYLQYQREYEFSAQAIYQYTLKALATGGANQLDETERQLLIDKVLRKHSWAQICTELKLTGKKQAQQGMKNVIAQLNG